ncbi:NAD(P)-binding protein [Pseudoclavibacter endophyticus]|uniref:NAD(P)-binding protein n=2 Tax=Pseudoclavibacter endophyticus TaxID=1778590 RepID=A0A6H9WNT9_9MICO|nr:NAD(P)-binding protein [Pseudoclavibacter endophyticus]
MKVAIIGAGIGGLSAGIALSQAGHEVTVYEQARAIGEVGAGIGVAPNGLRMYERLGLRGAIEAVAARYADGSSYFRADGEPIGEMTTADSSGQYFTLGLHRADLVDVLATALGRERLRTGHRLESLEQTATDVTLRFAEARKERADLVIGADGIHSVVRQAVVPGLPSPTPSGSIAYRGLVPASDLPEWPRGVGQLWMGEGKHFLTYPVRGGELINYVGFVPSHERLKESWSAVGDVDRLRADFAGWDPRVGRLLDAVQSTFWWGLYDREPLPTWTSGRVTLLGDAAHAMLPHLGQGANQAVEDAMVLAEVLSAAEPTAVESALERYERLRRERTTAVQRGARDNGRRYDSGYDDLGQRDDEIRGSKGLRLWLYDYDAQQAARSLVAGS